MIPFFYVLIADGSSDRSLVPIVSWAIRQVQAKASLAPPKFIVRGGQSIDETLRDAISSYRPDLVFVHRDAEGIPRNSRRREIPSQHAVVPVIPVRMTEASLTA